MSTLKVFQVFSITAKYLQYSLRASENIVELKRRWSVEMASLFNLHIVIRGAPEKFDGPCIFIGNHISYLDIPILMHSFPAITFVSKKEVKHWPVIGIAAKKIETIFVERMSKDSKAEAKKLIAKTLKENNQKVAIFPSGTTSLLNSPFWKRGAFEIAKDNEIEILPFRIRYEPLEKAAYVGDDTFFFHMLELFKIPRINVFLEFHEKVSVTDVDLSCTTWKEWCEGVF